MQKNIKIFLKNILYQIIKNNFNIIQIYSSNITCGIPKIVVRIRSHEKNSTICDEIQKLEDFSQLSRGVILDLVNRYNRKKETNENA